MVLGLGRYTAMCGATVYPASLTAPPGLRCAVCVLVLEAGSRRHQRYETRNRDALAVLKRIWPLRSGSVKE